MNRLPQESLSDGTAVQIAEYVCGLLGPDEHAQIHRLLSHDDAALAHALAWEERLLALVDALPRAQPNTTVRERLQRTLGIGPAPLDEPPPQLQLLRQRSAPAAPIARTLEPTSPLAAATSAPSPSIAPRAASPGPTNSVAKPAAPPVTSQVPRAAEARPSEQAGSVRSTTPRPAETSTASRPAGASTVSRPAEASTASRPAAGTSSGAAGDTTPGVGEPTASQPSETTASRSGATPSTDHDRQRRRLVRKLWLWRLISLCAVSAAVFGFVVPGEPPPPPVQVIKVAPTRAAILQAPGTTSTPGWTATLDAQGNLIMQPLVHTEVPAGSQAVLWTRSATVPEPRLLGHIDPNRPVQIPAARLGVLAQDQLLEITLERDEDATQGNANGPILFIGQMTMFGSEAAATGAEALGAATGGPITQAPPAR